MSDKQTVAGDVRERVAQEIEFWLVDGNDTYIPSKPDDDTYILADRILALLRPEPGLRDAMERLAKSYCDEAVRYRAAEIEPQIYLEEAASDIRAQIALARPASPELARIDLDAGIADGSIKVGDYWREHGKKPEPASIEDRSSEIAFTDDEPASVETAATPNAVTRQTMAETEAGVTPEAQFSTFEREMRDPDFRAGYEKGKASLDRSEAEALRERIARAVAGQFSSHRKFPDDFRGAQVAWIYRITDAILRLIGDVQREAWIPVSDRLPDREQTAVLVYVEENQCQYAAYRSGGRWYVWGSISTREMLFVTHWMPLPDAPARRFPAPEGGKT